MVTYYGNWTLFLKQSLRITKVLQHDLLLPAPPPCLFTPSIFRTHIFAAVPGWESPQPRRCVVDAPETDEGLSDMLISNQIYFFGAWLISLALMKFTGSCFLVISRFSLTSNTPSLRPAPSVVNHQAPSLVAWCHRSLCKNERLDPCIALLYIPSASGNFSSSLSWNMIAMASNVLSKSGWVLPSQTPLVTI